MISKMQHPDQKYIVALQSNNSKLINEIYEKFSSRIKWMILQNNGDESDAENIFQEALIAIYLKKDFILTCPFDALLYSVCWRKWLSELKNRGRGGVTFINPDEYITPGEDIQNDSDIILIYEERRNLYRKMLRNLSEGCQQLLALNLDGKSMKEVANDIGTTHGFARKKKSICMAKLIAMIKESPDFDSTQW